MSETATDSFVTDRDQDTFGGDVVATASPATQIVLLYLVLTILVGGLVGAFLYQNPDLFGDGGNARIAGLVVLGLTAIGAIRLAIKYIVLYRTRYIVTADSVRRQYHLAYREESRELPLHMIRGVELSKSRVQALLGFATISFLSVGSNRGIGYVEFDNAADPERLQDAVLELLEKQRDQALEDDDDSSSAATDQSSNRGGRQRDAPPAPQSASNGRDRTDPASDGPDDGPSDDAVAESDASGNDARRPVSGNDDQPSAAEPDARD
jgi:hypothetical protein